MNREIKFRVWLKEGLGNRIIYDPVIGRGKASEIFNEFWMQYTGLKDKNGKEIYESDILLGSNDSKVIVVYQAPSFVKKKSYYSKSWTQFIIAPQYNQFEEILGNMYENPELLEKK